MKNSKLENIARSALLLSIGIVLPFLTGQLQQIGNMLLPMHIPVILCGLVCGWKYGMSVGFIVPLLRSVMFGMPLMYPNAIAMAFELATYGATVGFLYERSRWKCIKALYKCMLAAMLAGRLVWGVMQIILLGFDVFTMHTFITMAFLNAIPGIAVQLIIIPAIMVALGRAKVVHFMKKSHNGK